MKKHLVAVIVVLLIEAITYFIEMNKTGNSNDAFYLVLEVAVLVGIFAVVMLSAEDSFGSVCLLAEGPIITVVVTGFTIIFTTGINPGVLITSLLTVGALIVFGLVWVDIDEYLKNKSLKKEALLNS
ncbi:MAG: hypothetical protein WDK96_02205 [Candidatus Paceibacterota bacterium]